MTVACHAPFADMPKDLAMFDSLDALTETELQLFACDFSGCDVPVDIVGVDEPSLGAWPCLGDPVVPTTPACSVEHAGSSPPGFVKLEDLSPVSALAASTPPSSSGGASPASSGSDTSYVPAGGSSAVSSDYKPARKDPRIGRRKPEVDLTSITDIAERRKQRRLAKNRATAATSRERKRAQLSTLQTRVTKLEQDNAHLSALLADRDALLASLQGDLHNVSGGMFATGGHSRGGH